MKSVLRSAAVELSIITCASTYQSVDTQIYEVSLWLLKDQFIARKLQTIHQTKNNIGKCGRNRNFSKRTLSSCVIRADFCLNIFKSRFKNMLNFILFPNEIRDLMIVYAVSRSNLHYRLFERKTLLSLYLNVELNLLLKLIG
jgi:hypothetical protein